ncbi:hypothetical protein Stsp02_75870 [Streptomyces sp. NBRC 14336]|nr:hypothetical protein Stsp02_75870 [Streptomyces sp. NBRC 14336]
MTQHARTRPVRESIGVSRHGRTAPSGQRSIAQSVTGSLAPTAPGRGSGARRYRRLGWCFRFPTGPQGYGRRAVGPPDDPLATAERADSVKRERAE